MLLLRVGADKMRLMRKRSQGLARGCASPPDRYRSSLEIFHDVFPRSLLLPPPPRGVGGTRGGSRDFPLQVFSPYFRGSAPPGAAAGPGMSRARGEDSSRISLHAASHLLDYFSV